MSLNNIREDKIPTFDLHRHLSGSIRPEVVWDILKNSSQSHFGSLEEVYRSMTYRQSIGPREFYTFLKKFNVFNHVEWTEDNLIKVLRSIVKDIRREGLKYVELRFSVDKYLPYFDNAIGAIKFICGVITGVANHNGIEIKLFLGFKHETNKDTQSSIAKVIDNPEVVDALDGIDLIGDESKFDADFFAPIYKEWRAAGKLLTAHVGETNANLTNNIKLAIEKLNVHRIGHGICIMKDPHTAALAKDKNICFEISLTSNWITSVVPKMPEHPIRTMFDAGLKIALCTDDPAIFGTSMAQEFTIARMSLGFNDEEINEMKQNAIDYSFKNLLKKV